MSVGRSECNSCRVVIDSEEDCYCGDCYSERDKKVDELEGDIAGLEERIVDLEKQLEEV